MEKKIYIHAGCHRGGSSSFQLCLSHNRTVLSDAGFDVAYPGRDGVPGGKLKLRLPAPRHRPRHVNGFAEGAGAQLTTISPNPERPLIISEENIPGRMIHFYNGQFFPASGLRMKTLSKALGARPEHVVYVVRRYADLYVSAYRKRAEDNKVPPFHEIKSNLLNMDRGWADLIEDLMQFLNPRALTVVEYENRGASRDMLAGLVPELENAGLDEPAGTLNRSATDSAIEVLQARYQAGETLDRPAWKKVIEDHADDRSDKGFASFTDAERDTLDTRYQADLKRIATIPGVRLI